MALHLVPIRSQPKRATRRRVLKPVAIVSPQAVRDEKTELRAVYPAGYTTGRH